MISNTKHLLLHICNHILFLWFPFLEIDCQKIESIGGMVVEPFRTTHGSTAKFECDQGYRLSDGRQSTNVSCSDVGTWIPQPSCKGKGNMLL